MSVEFYRESPGKFDSRTLSRKTLNRWTGRNRLVFHHVGTHHRARNQQTMNLKTMVCKSLFIKAKQRNHIYFACFPTQLSLLRFPRATHPKQCAYWFLVRALMETLRNQHLNEFWSMSRFGYQLALLSRSRTIIILLKAGSAYELAEVWEDSDCNMPPPSRTKII